MRKINRAETWEKVYDAFQQINFAAWDYESIKQSLLDHLKIYFPEAFSDFIETSELVTIIESFAYVAELIAYRLDLNTHENFITTAERKESVLRLAKLLSYSSSRNIPSRGLVKINSISTTERIFDSNGNDLSNVIVNWNDQINTNWKEQFILVLNSILSQNFGTVLPSDRVQVQDVRIELYELNNQPLVNGVIPYNISVSNENYPMELVPSVLNEFGPLEKRPEINSRFNILYLNDGLGDGSENTGFFIFTKQGTLQKTTTTFDGVTPNQFFDVRVDNCNEIDVWVNNIDPNTGEILSGSDTTATVRLGEWQRVDLANSQNVIFNTNPQRNKFEIETLDRDNFRLIFGDGKFANIPSGTFDIWYRVSSNSELVIPTTAIQNQTATINYFDKNNNNQTFSFTFSLVDPIQNSAPSESIDRIKRVAPSVYYTQDRMVNGRDYNEFLLQDNSILKLRAINRTFAGDSKYIYWHDPNEYYENVKIFGDDLVLYFKTKQVIYQISGGELPDEDGGENIPLINALINNHIEPIFSSEDFFIKSVLEGVQPRSVRNKFLATERSQLEDFLLIQINNTPSSIYLKYNISNNIWDFFSEGNQPSDWWVVITANVDNSWTISFTGNRLIAHSTETDFYISNDKRKTITYDTLNSNLDEIVVLKANVGTQGILTQNYNFSVLSQEIIDVGKNIGLESIRELVILPGDSNKDGLVEDPTVSFLIGQNSYVYFNRRDVNSEWVWVPGTSENILKFNQSVANNDGLWKRERGISGINFLWLHRTPRYHLIDPSPSNIIDIFIIQRGYYNSLRNWLSGRDSEKPDMPTSYQLRADYNRLLNNKMISDTIILHPGKIKLIFGDKANDDLKAFIKVIRSANRNLTNNQIKILVVDAINEFFDINVWEFGETFYFTELAAFIHNKLPVDIDSVVVVPKNANNSFGDMFQIFAKEDEIIQPSISVNDIEIVESFNPDILRQKV
jgi:hypothetical protein